MWDLNLQCSDPESMEQVATPGGDLLVDLLADLLTPCVGTLRSIFVYLTNLGQWRVQFSAVKGRPGILLTGPSATCRLFWSREGQGHCESVDHFSATVHFSGINELTFHTKVATN